MREGADLGRNTLRFHAPGGAAGGDSEDEENEDPHEPESTPRFTFLCDGKGLAPGVHLDR